MKKWVENPRWASYEAPRSSLNPAHDDMKLGECCPSRILVNDKHD